MLTGSLLLGGLLPLSHSARDGWAPSGAWRWPVGDPYELITERPAEPGRFFLLRSVDTDGFKVTHQGVDLGSGASGAFVRAAAAGLVVRAADHGEHGGYGTHVVLAHRLPGGSLAYSVYAHLRTASIRVKPGQFVPAGTRLGRVGMTGRATTPHLHFEVRTSTDPGARWELANVEDPVSFVDERLPSHRADTSGLAAYLEWAECASLLPTKSQGDDVLSREAWWRMLAVTDRGSLCDPALPGEFLRDSLISAGTLKRTTPAANASQPMEWSELANDLNHIRRSSLRGGKAPFRKAKHRTLLEANLGTATPTRRISELSGRPGRPSLGEAVLLLADLAGPAPEPPKPAAPPATKPTPARVDSVARVGAAAPVAAKSSSTKSTRSITASRASIGDSISRSKPAATRPDSLARAVAAKAGPVTRSATARPDTLAKAKAVAARADSLARALASKAGGSAKSAAARPIAGAKTSPAAARSDSLARASAAKSGSAAKSAAARPDSGAKAKPVAARSDSLAKTSASKAGTSAKTAATRPSTSIKVTPVATRSDSLAKASTTQSGSTVKPKSATRADSTAKAKTAPPRADSTAKAKTTTARADSTKAKSAKPAAPAPARPPSPAPAKVDSSRS